MTTPCPKTGLKVGDRVHLLRHLGTTSRTPMLGGETGTVQRIGDGLGCDLPRAYAEIDGKPGVLFPCHWRTEGESWARGEAPEGLKEAQQKERNHEIILDTARPLVREINPAPESVSMRHDIENEVAGMLQFMADMWPNDVQYLRRYLLEQGVTFDSEGKIIL